MTFARVLLPAGLALLLATGARAELPRPACDAIAAWAEGYERGAGWSPNGLGGRDRFSALFADARTAALFGKPVLEWTPEEARALAPHLGGCADTLRRGGNRAAAAALPTLRNQALRDVPGYLTDLAEARAGVPRLLGELAEAPVSPALLRFHEALGAFGREAEAIGRANQAMSGLSGAARNAARHLLAALRDLPEAELAPAVAPALARLPALRTGLREALVGEFAAAPATLAGLQALDRRAPQLLAEYAPALGPEEAARAEAALAARREAIGEALRDDLLRQVAAVPADPSAGPALNRLRQQAAQAYAPAIGAEGVRAVEAAIVARRGAIGTELVERILADMARASATPASLAGLRRLEAEEPNPAVFVLIGPDGLRRVREAAAERRAALGGEVAAEVLRQVAAVPTVAEGFAALEARAPASLLALLPEAEAARVGAAAAERRGRIAEAMLPGFRAGLAQLPDTEEGMAHLDAEILPEIASWPASAAAEKARFAALAQERRTAILAAVNRAEAGPLRGRVYEGPRMTLEFLDRTRVVLTEPGAPPVAGTYTEERDGRVIVTAGAMSVVMTREGRRLVAGPLEARRVR